jgi:hypothetical protein
MVSAWRADTKDTLLADTINVFCSSGLYTIREQAMATLVNVLEAFPPLDELDNRCFTVFTLCCESIKKSLSTFASAKETRLAYRVVALLALMLHTGASDLLPMTSPLLSNTLHI